ncbi:hypothetical protein MXB_4429 [Myxobolus squamalis]|nr:hypothetical protein MXB_4429 [Myxobolus squamalis]
MGVIRNSDNSLHGTTCAKLKMITDQIKFLKEQVFIIILITGRRNLSRLSNIPNSKFMRL